MKLFIKLLNNKNGYVEGDPTLLSVFIYILLILGLLYFNFWLASLYLEK